MRIHYSDVTSADPLVKRLAQGSTVYCNGNEVKYCTLADEEKGYVEYWGDGSNPDNRSDSTYRLEGYVEIRDPMGQHVRKPYEAIGKGKDIKYTIARSYVDECSKHGIDAVAEARSIWGNEIEIEVVDQLELDKDGNTV